MRRLSGYISVCLLACIALSSCTFGDKEISPAGLAKKTRRLSYFYTALLPYVGDTLCDVLDYGVYGGLYLGWGDEASISVFGKEFCFNTDTLEGDAAQPYPITFNYNYYQDGAPVKEDGFSKLSCSFTTYGKHGPAVGYTTCLPIIFPYSKTFDKNGKRYKARVDSIPLDFTGQDGLLSTLRSKYYIAQGWAKGVCYKSTVTMADSADHCQAGHDHDALREGEIILETKMAIVRLSLVVPWGPEDLTLPEYLRALRQSGGESYYISSIELGNEVEHPSGISSALLDMNDGYVKATDDAETSLVLVDDRNAFWNHEQIDQLEAEPLSFVGGEGYSWGTSLYVAIPCPDVGKLDIDPLITVTLIKSGTETEVTSHLYGRIERTELLEGCYYVTSPISLFSSEDKANNSPAEICKVPQANESYKQGS